MPLRVAGKWAMLVALCATASAACEPMTDRSGGPTMSTKDTTQLSWEWPADRSPERTVLAEVDRVEAQKSGSVANSPSMSAHLPDPVLLEVRVIDGADAERGRLSLRLPKSELGAVSAGDVVALGLVEDAICICIEKAPAELDEKARAEWFSTWSCPQP